MSQTLTKLFSRTVTVTTNTDRPLIAKLIENGSIKERRPGRQTENLMMLQQL